MPSFMNTLVGVDPIRNAGCCVTFSTFRSDQSTKNQKQQHETINMNEIYNQDKTNIRHQVPRKKLQVPTNRIRPNKRRKETARRPLETKQEKKQHGVRKKYEME